MLKKTIPLILGFYLLSCLVGLSAAKAEEPQSVESIFTELESGITLSQEQLTQKLTYLKESIPEQDQANYLRLQVLICWNYDVSNEKQITQAIAFANRQIEENNTLQFTESLLDMKLCKAWFQD